MSDDNIVVLRHYHFTEERVKTLLPLLRRLKARQDNEIKSLENKNKAKMTYVGYDKDYAHEIAYQNIIGKFHQQVMTLGGMPGYQAVRFNGPQGYWLWDYAHDILTYREVPK